MTSISEMILHQLIVREAMAKAPTKLKGIRVKGVSLTKEGKVEKDDKAPPHVRAGRRRKANKVTGVKRAAWNG